MPFEGTSPLLSISVILVDVAMQYYNIAETGGEGHTKLGQ